MQNLWLPQRGVRSPLYYPKSGPLPAGDVYAIGFDFSNTGALATNDHAEAVNEDFLLTHITANTDAAQNAFFFLQIYHQHGTVQRQIFSKLVRMDLVAGSGPLPVMLNEPYFIAQGDTVTVAISNVAKNGGAYAAANIQVALWGIHPDKAAPAPRRLQGPEDVVLALKKLALNRMQSTIPAAAGIQTAHARSFQVDTPQPLPAYPGAGAAMIELARYQVPAGMSGTVSAIAIVHVGAAGSFLDGSGTVLWHVLRNGAPEKGLENLYAQIGTISQPTAMTLLLNQNDLIQVMVEIPAGKAAPAGNPFARLVGFLDYGGFGTQAPLSGTVNPVTGVPTPVAGGSGGGAGSRSVIPAGSSCFTGNVAFKVRGGLLRFDQSPARVEIENETGYHLAELLVHEFDGELIEFAPQQGVTFDHLFKYVPGVWVPAVEKYAGCKSFRFTGSVYNLHVCTQDPEDQHYILENGAVAHNAKANWLD